MQRAPQAVGRVYFFRNSVYFFLSSTYKCNFLGADNKQ